jgi:hypothetical protein
MILVESVFVEGIEGYDEIVPVLLLMLIANAT